MNLNKTIASFCYQFANAKKLKKTQKKSNQKNINVPLHRYHSENDELPEETGLITKNQEKCWILYSP